ncbi:MAG: PucR family transcriptional regulator ligand-binding domain-containing protein [Candidatus Dormibacteraeota bacterium]|nr:PucR family transcriptional regulator ligand-binding domain-containing protein [Candidatus Dormibacteraeota bacterium]
MTTGEPAEQLIQAPTVAEAMRLGGFDRAKLVAGAGGLGRRVEWVRVIETPETARRARTGDLLLTTAYPIKDDPAAQLDLVATIAAVGGSGLVVKPGMYVQGLPDGMAAEADRLNLPLFILSQDVPWADLMEPLLERIINAEHSRLKQSMAIHRRFTELVLDGKGLDEIARTLSELLGSAVSIEDATFHLLAHAGGSDVDKHRRETIARHGTPPRVLFDPGIQQVLREVAEHRGPMKVPAFPRLGMDRERIIAPIYAANQVLGYISVLDHPPDAEELAFMAMENAATVVAMALIKEREVAAAESSVRGEFLEDLAQGSYGEEAAAHRRARHLGYPMTGHHVLVIVDIDGFGTFSRSRQLTEEMIQSLKREYLRRVSGTVKRNFQRALLGPRSDSVLALIPLGPDSEGHEPRIRALADQLRDAIGEWKPGFTVSVGFSAPTSAPGGVAAAHREVRGVMETLTRFGRRNQVVSANELGVTGLLASVADERLADFAQRHLGRLADHDRRRGGELVDTLRAFLETGEQQAAARRLKVHPNTLRYRLDRIIEITGAELTDPETRLNLAVALRVQGLLDL